MRLHAPLAILLLVYALPLGAVTVYKSVDAQGRVSYSDLPPASGETAATLEINDYPTGLSAEDMTRLREMRETTDRMREDRRDRERERERAREAQRPLYPALPPPPPQQYSREEDYHYLVPPYYPRRRAWHRPYYGWDDEPRPPMTPNPRAASPEGLRHRIRQNY